MLRELQEENQQTEGERASLNRALQNETATGKDQMARIVRLEKDLRDLRVELEQKIEMGVQFFYANFFSCFCSLSFFIMENERMCVYNNNSNNNNDNERISSVPFHVKHTQLRLRGANTKIQNTCI